MASVGCSSPAALVAIIPRSMSIAGRMTCRSSQWGSPLENVACLRFYSAKRRVELVVLMDVEVARVLALGLAGKPATDCRLRLRKALFCLAFFDPTNSGHEVPVVATEC